MRTKVKLRHKLIITFFIIVMSIFFAGFTSKSLGVTDDQFNQKISQPADWYTLIYLQDSAEWGTERYMKFDAKAFLSRCSQNYFPCYVGEDRELGHYSMMGTGRSASCCIAPNYHVESNQFRIATIVTINPYQVVVNNLNGEERITKINDSMPIEQNFAQQLAYFAYRSGSDANGDMLGGPGEGSIPEWNGESTYEWCIRFQMVCKRWYESFGAWGVPEYLSTGEPSNMAEAKYLDALRELKELHNNGFGFEARIIFLDAGYDRHYGQNNIIFGGRVIPPGGAPDSPGGPEQAVLGINKVSKSTGLPMKDVKFTVQNEAGMYLKQDGTFSQDRIELITNEKGTIEVTNTVDPNNPNNVILGDLKEGMVLNVTEVGILNTGPGEENYGYESSGLCVPIVLRNGYNPVYFQNVKAKSKIIIKKIDQDSGEPLAGVGFRIQMVTGKCAGQYLGVDSNGFAIYSNDPDTKVFTNENGEIIINEAWKGTYKAVETDCPIPGYFKKEQIEKGFEIKDPLVIDIDEVTITIPNRLRYINLSGNVWEDNPYGKAMQNNWLLAAEPSDIEDELLAGVTVTLHILEGPTLTTTTDSQGRYEFAEMELDKLKDKRYYIEFSYNGLGYESVPVASGGEKGSHAKESSSARQNLNNKFREITNNKASGISGDLQYKQGGNESIFDYGSGCVYGYSYADTPINGSNNLLNQVKITSSTLNAIGYSQLIETKRYRYRYSSWTDEDGVSHTHTIKIPYYTYKAPSLNLGLYKRERPDLAIMKDLQNVKIEKAGFPAQTYEYAQRYLHEGKYNGDMFGIGVKFKENSKFAEEEYTRAIYEADFRDDKNANELSVRLIYRIDLKNASTSLSARVNSIIDYFDSKYEDGVRATTEITERGELAGEELKCDRINMPINGDYKGISIDTSNILIPKQERRSIYVEFKLSRKNVENMLADVPEGEASNEPLDNITEINSYSIYDANNRVYAGIDKNSNPGNIVINNKSTWEDDTCSAPALKLVKAERRTLEGQTFVDTPTPDSLNKGTREGDGKLVSGEEGPIGEVEVRMIKADTGEVAEYWNGTDWSKAQLNISEEQARNGEYKFENYPAGEYKIQFIWGEKFNQEDYSVQKYKATIYKDEAHQGEAWYQDIDNRYSDAYDDWKQRQQIDHQMDVQRYDTYTRPQPEYSNYDNYPTSDLLPISTNWKDGELINKITSSTDKFAARIEYESNDENPEIYKDSTGREYDYHIRNIDFGIVERPRQRAELVKNVTHLKISESEGTGHPIVDCDVEYNGDGSARFVDADPTNTNNPGVHNDIIEAKPVPSNNTNRLQRDKGTFSLILANSRIQGVSVQATYTLTVKNISEYDFNDPTFYKYGTIRENEIPTERLVQIAATNIVDYVDNEWAYDENQERMAEMGWNRKDIVDLNGLVDESVLDIAIPENEIMERKILNTEYLRNTYLYPNNNPRGPLKSEADVLLTTVATGGTGLKEYEFNNEAEMIEIQKTGGGPLDQTASANDARAELTLTPGNYIPGRIDQLVETEIDDAISQGLTIIPPTGEDRRLIIPILIGVTLFGIIGAGIVFIKKKVLR